MQSTLMKSEMGKDGDQGEGSKIQRTTTRNLYDLQKDSCNPKL